MFLENGFNDFLSKPINSSELQEIVKKYLPPAKLRMEANNNPQAALNREEQVRRKSIITFVKENRDTFTKITGALSSGDIETAHRIAHTLKSIAGYLGKTALQEAAFALENSLQNGTADHTPQQLDTFEKELASALGEFEPLVKEAESKKHEVVQIDAGEKASLLAEIRPLLEKGDFAAANYVDKLKGIKGMGELAERIDDYDYNGALQLLNKIPT
jgi:HPt (histidine-containing phosphotransfer) domain-containing protein